LVASRSIRRKAKLASFIAFLDGRRTTCLPYLDFSEAKDFLVRAKLRQINSNGHRCSGAIPASRNKFVVSVDKKFSRSIISETNLKPFFSISNARSLAAADWDNK